MAKTDKELTAEIVCEIIRAWGISQNSTPIQSSQVPDIIKSIYDTVSKLDLREK